MATAEELMQVVGKPVDSKAVRALAVTDALVASTEEDLEEGTPLETFLSNPAAGYQLMHHSGRIASAFLYAAPAEGFAAFPGSLPGGLRHNATRTQVLARFGKPERTGEPFTSPFIGRQGAWDRFVIDGLRVHFQYDEPEERVLRVTIMTALDAP